MPPLFSRLRRAAPEPAVRVPDGRRRRGWLAALVVAALLAVALVSQRWWLAPLVAHELAASSGRRVHVGALWIGLGGELQPVLFFRDVDIGNTPWAGSHQPFAVVGSGAAFFSWRSLADRRPVIERLVLHDARIDMERLADGRRNWRLSDPDNRGPGHFRVLALEADRSSLHFLNRGIDLDLDVASAPNLPDAGVPGKAAGTAASAATAGTGVPGEAAAAALPKHLTLRGHWRSLAFAANVDTGAELTFRETGRSTKFRGELLAGGARLRADGQAGDLFLAPVVDARIDFAGEKLGPLRAFFGGRPDDDAPLRPYRLIGHFTAARQAFGLSDATAKIGATDLAGELGVVRGAPRSRISAKLQSRSTSLADLTWLAGVGAAAAGTPPRPLRHDATVAVAKAASSVAGAAVSTARAETARTPFASARRFDADLRFEARHVDAAGWPMIESAKFGGTLEDGAFGLAEFDVGIGGGHAAGTFSLDTRQAPAPARLDLTWREVRLEALLRAPAVARRVRGALDGQLHLSAAGASGDALLQSASGRGSATLSAGHISGLLDAEIGLQGGKILSGLLRGPEQIAIRCAAASADLRDGAATLQGLVLDTERTRLTGTGRIDLAHRTLDVTLTPQAKERGLLDLERSIRIHGALKKPEHELVARRAPTQATCNPG